MTSARIEELNVSAYTIPTEAPESDGTYEWTATTIVIVHVVGAGEHGVGYTYADRATATLIKHHLQGVVIGRDAMAIPAIWAAMVHSIRNLGRPGICSMAISAIDTALWDLKARLLGLPLVRLFGQIRPTMPVYGSGGFTSYSIDELQEQFRGWAKQRISRVKMKVGRDPAADVARVAAARAAVGDEVDIFVDANGAYARKQALAQAEKFSEYNVTWFEEPVSSDDLQGLRFIRDRAPAGTEIAAGEYGYEADYFRRMLEAGAVDVLQADATRCGGFTGFLQAAMLCDAHHLSLSAHCAPALHLPLGCAISAFRHAEYFFDHARIERMFFDGPAEPVDGVMRPDLARPGIGLEFKAADAERFRVK
jgi:L-alanine-DL-glutamate epimerase-like enolase superfamily enzyme